MIAWVTSRFTKRTIGASSSMESPTDEVLRARRLSSKDDARSSISSSARQYRSIACSRSSRVATTDSTGMRAQVARVVDRQDVAGIGHRQDEGAVRGP